MSDSKAAVDWAFSEARAIEQQTPMDAAMMGFDAGSAHMKAAVLAEIELAINAEEAIIDQFRKAGAYDGVTHVGQRVRGINELKRRVEAIE